MIQPPRLAVFALMALGAACGKKGPPLAPLHLVPGPTTDVSVRRLGPEAQMRFVIPSTNVNGPGRVEIDRVEVYAVTVAPGSAQPTNRELLSEKYLVGSVPVKPPPVEDEAPQANAPPDSRPGPGEPATFVEALTDDKLKPVKFVGIAALPGSVPPRTASAAGVAVTGAAATAAGAAATPPAAGATPVPPTGGAATGATPPAAVPSAPPSAPAGATGTSPQAAAAAAPRIPPVPAPTYPVRVYVTRGMTKRGRAGQPSARTLLPIVAPPAPPSGLTGTVTEHAVVLKWTAPPAPVADAPAVTPAAPTAPAATPPAPPSAPAVAPAVAPAPAFTFNVYKVDGTTPINGEPIAASEYEHTGVLFGTEQCFTVRTVAKVAAISLESAAATPSCVTPRDTFPPAEPKGLSIVAGPGTINLSWDANREPDLAGYLVMRAEAAGGALQPLTPAPITGTSFEDRTARPGVRYAYAIVAVDQASPPNRSAPSARVEETAR